MTFLGYVAYQEGNPQKLIGGLDYRGKICGYDKPNRNKFNWNLVSWMGEGVCLNECPTETTDFNMDWFDSNNLDQLICKTPENVTEEENDALEDVQAALNDWWQSFPFFKVYYGDCMLKFQSTSYLGYCVFDDMSLFTWFFDTYFDFGDDFDIEAVTESANAVTDIVGDIYASREYILLFGFGGAFLCAYVYAYAMRIPIITKTVVWGSIWSIFFLALGLAGYAHYMVGVYRAEVPMLKTESDIKMLQTLSSIFFIGAMCWLCLILYLKDRLTLAIGLVIQTAKAITSMPVMIILIPAIQVVAFFVFAVIWFGEVILMASMGDIQGEEIAVTDDDGSPSVQIKSFSYDRDQQRLAWFMLFGYFWTTEFIVAAGQMITAMCLCCFYFTRNKAMYIGNTTVIFAIFLVCRYHLGTIAFGAALVAIVKLIRAYLAYLEKYAGGGDTKLKKMILRCLQVFAACLERCIKFINFNAYIQTCIHGTSFCVSAANAFWLIMRNIARIAAVTGVTHFLGFIGKLAVIMGTASAFYYTMDHFHSDEVKNLVVPTLIVAIIAGFVAIMFFEVFGMGTTVLLQCFIADEEMHKDDPENCFADGDLKKYLNKHGKSRKKKKAGDGAKK